jgi:hypothetical protein
MTLAPLTLAVDRSDAMNHIRLADAKNIGVVNRGRASLE